MRRLKIRKRRRRLKKGLARILILCIRTGSPDRARPQPGDIRNFLLFRRESHRRQHPSSRPLNATSFPAQRVSHPTMAASSSSSFKITQLAVPAVTVLIIFLAYSSQYLFLHIEPEPLTTPQLIKFNALLCCLWICYARACAVNPGHVPAGWRPRREEEDDEDGMKLGDDNNAGNVEDYFSGGRRQRWCRRCEASKPPRAHHCKTCQR